MHINEELDRLYSPSKWSPRMASSEIVVAHENHLKNYSNQARAKIPTLKVPYDDKCKETIIEFYDSSINPYEVSFDDYNLNNKTIFVYLHGGYWQWGCYSWSGFMAEPLEKHSFIVAALGYDIAPECSMTRIVEQVEQGFVKILTKVQKTSSRIIICGHSAGAHLATSLLYVNFKEKYDLDDSYIKSFVLVSGVYDLVPLLKTEVNLNLKMDVTEAEKLSSLKRNSFKLSNLKNLNFLIVYAEFDSPAFKQQSIEFSETLKSSLSHDLAKVNCHEIKNMDHFNLIENLSDETYSLTQTKFGKFIGHVLTEILDKLD